MMDASVADGSASSRDYLEIQAKGESRPLPAWFAACDAFGLWIERHRQRRALMSLSDNMLSDIGISRSDAFQEYSKPFWRK
jgi:uncharacterized protein YjiS (DUF1127 family)